MDRIEDGRGRRMRSDAGNGRWIRSDRGVEVGVASDRMLGWESLERVDGRSWGGTGPEDGSTSCGMG
eukprot:579148-Rhodomonas_salina.1